MTKINDNKQTRFWTRLFVQYQPMAIMSDHQVCDALLKSVYFFFVSCCLSSIYLLISLQPGMLVQRKKNNERKQSCTRTYTIKVSRREFCIKPNEKTK